eukprot:CAMPEP_0179089402 /NCGR_PEP_ID=MMETSP0796-20121207/40735_1 /TAXON_ID=73915 /ORGANISM="Pyrodinium bahamense, Strain pbaha01" /LENGTH=112 /DNA_ID=CAMNT_0020786959 /DNA_START=208 /DNA_END=542 /DNA_ORIENTATION=+
MALVFFQSPVDGDNTCGGAQLHPPLELRAEVSCRPPMPQQIRGILARQQPVRLGRAGAELPAGRTVRPHQRRLESPAVDSCETVDVRQPALRGSAALASFRSRLLPPPDLRR